MMLNKAREGWSYLLTKLNAVGSLLLAYALLYPNALSELKELAPEGLRPFVPALALGWFVLVQIAKASALKKAEAEKTAAVRKAGA